jgi:hypothetical protein
MSEFASAIGLQKLRVPRCWLAIAAALVVSAMTPTSGAAFTSPGRSQAAPRFTVLTSPVSVPASARVVSLRIASSVRAVLRVRGRIFRVGTHARRVAVPISRGRGILVLRLTLRAARGSTAVTVRVPRTTAWQTVLAGIDRRGRVSKRMALQAFSLALGRLPGVSVPRGPVGEIASATAAVRWIRGYWLQLTPAQRAAASKILARPRPRAVANLFGVRDLRHDYEAKVKEIIRTIANHLDRSLPPTLTVTVSVGYAPAQRPEPNTLGWADVVDSKGDKTGVPARCEIHLLPELASRSLSFQTAVLAHESFHCFQATKVPLALYNSATAPSWIFEGQAEWVGGEIAGDPQTTYARDWWRLYLMTPGQPLFERTYDALGFYAHMQESSLGPWQRFDAMLQSIARGSEESAYEDATAASDRFHLSWASGYFRDGSLGLDWTFKGNGITADAPSPDLLTVPPRGAARPLRAPPYTEAIASVHSNAEITHFSVTGYGRLIDRRFGFEFLKTTLSDIYFCTRAQPCKCPPGSAYNGPRLWRLKDPPYLALTGGPDGAKAAIAGLQLDSFCKKKPRASGLTGAWSGEAHSVVYGESLSFHMTLTQTGTALSGTIVWARAICGGLTDTGQISGQVGGQQVSAQISYGTFTTSFTGTVNGDHMSGSWSSPEGPSCTADSGTWTASRS